MCSLTTLGPKAPVIDQQYSSTSNSITINWEPGTSSQQVGSSSFNHSFNTEFTKIQNHGQL